MMTYFNDKNHKSKKKYKIINTLHTILKSKDMLAFFGATLTSMNLSSTGIGLIVLPLSAGIACTLSLGSKVLHK